MLTSYNFWYVIKEDDVHISEVAIRFYEGDISTKNEKKHDPDPRLDSIAPVTRYRRTKRLQVEDLPHESNRRTKKENDGNDCFIYTNKDFGVTSDLDDIRVFLNKVLNKDKDRTPIDEQKEVEKAKVKLQEIK